MLGTLSLDDERHDDDVKGLGRERRSRQENSRVKCTLAVVEEFPM